MAGPSRFGNISLLLICLSAAVVVVSCNKIESDEEPIVQLPNGKIRGLKRPGNYLSFESIPYAEPPIGKNRFEPPKPYLANWTGIRYATQHPVLCMQWDQFGNKKDLLSGVEDCLTINVYTPSLTRNKPYPVLVLVHGGAFTFSSAQENREDFLMANGKLIVVKMNYRLGPLGFLSTGDDVISGNFGLKDQLLALEWIKGNVAAFNGNPEKITVLGFSAGAASVHLHMMNKNFEKLAAAAVSMSGNALPYWVVDRNPKKKAVALATFLNCPTDSSSSIKRCLQDKDPTDIVRTIKEFQKPYIGYNPAVPFSPVVEAKTVQNAFLTEKPEIIIKSGKSARIPWLAAFTKNDGGYNAAEFMQKDSNGVELIEALNERWQELLPVNLYFKNAVDESELEAFTTSIRQKYMGDEKFTAQNYFLFQKMYTDVIFADSTKKSWNLHKEYTDSPFYGYVYDNPRPRNLGNTLSNRTDINFGTVHGDDFYLLFRGPDFDEVSFTENQKKMSSNFVRMIEDFCLKGNLQFGTCKFAENSSKTKGIVAMYITKDSCKPVSVDEL
ncbi:esterase-5B-like [Eupeodes corollae]|uniref:esterase-5B-like n=1 Tax=Eupeodes corollae TaxID=290404 RepID=UPI0024913E63|nr:esterase-5B-like [Eupeodes corollae]